MVAPGISNEIYWLYQTYQPTNTIENGLLWIAMDCSWIMCDEFQCFTDFMQELMDVDLYSTKYGWLI